MERQKTLSTLRALGLLVAGAIGLGAGSAASAEGVERAGTWLRSYAGPYDRQGQIRDAQGLVPDAQQRQPQAGVELTVEEESLLAIRFCFRNNCFG